ncbi:MAG TPA: hypothetical protein VGP83_18910 [Pyrinomonadaceae bacterium]|nr:hypothetical protein [Pyrinomonadaceae bacterium]
MVPIRYRSFWFIDDRLTWYCSSGIVCTVTPGATAPKVPVQLSRKYTVSPGLLHASEVFVPDL